LLIKYIKSILWRVAKRLSYIQDARCLKVKIMLINAGKEQGSVIHRMHITENDVSEYQAFKNRNHRHGQKFYTMTFQQQKTNKHNVPFSLVGNLPTQVSLPPLHQAVGFRCKMLGTVQHLDQVQSL